MLTIDDLSDDDLLAIFDFYVVRYQDLDLLEMVFSDQDTKRKIESWQSLVHVCRRWRCLVFGSPRRLNLQLYYDSGRSAKKTLDVWPAMPLLIKGHIHETSVDYVIAELEHNDRVCQIDLKCHTIMQIGKLWTAMQVPFPELASLRLSLRGFSHVPVLPDSFLGGSAPRLRYFALAAVPFPRLPNLLLSATHLVYLLLRRIPHSGYISPEAMATCLSMLTGLESLQLEFESPQSCPDQEGRRSPSLTRCVLPALTIFWFKGVTEYLEELVVRIDTPRLYQLSATFFNDIEFDIPELIRLVSHSSGSTFKAPNEAHVFFDSQTASVKLQPQASNVEYFEVRISCREPDWQLSSLAQICATSLPLLSATENLFIYEPVNSQLDWKDEIENIDWLELLLPFTAVKNIYLSKQFAPRIVPALQDISRGETTEVLSALQNLYLEGFQPSESVEEGIERFISARQLTNRAIAISVWDRDLMRVQHKSEEVDDRLLASLAIIG